MQAQERTLLEVMKLKDKAALKKMMSVSDAVADLNFKRFQAFDKQEEKQAALAFDGPAYKGLKAHTFTAKQQAYANAHLRILCGLYGVLRPFDKIRPYRLEMGNTLQVQYSCLSLCGDDEFRRAAFPMPCSRERDHLPVFLFYFCAEAGFTRKAKQNSVQNFGIGLNFGAIRSLDLNTRL